MKPDKPTAFKHLISEDLVKKYANGLKAVDKNFNEKSFIKITGQLKKLEMRDRVRLIAQACKDNLPANFEDALSKLMKAVRLEDLQGFSLWPTTEFIQLYGLENFESSFVAMQELTVKFTSEFAVRPFIEKYPQCTMQALLKVAQSENIHLRRWASEGSRPRLPWGAKLNSLVEDPQPGLQILELLKFDPELYVRKSVSNHLNDIAKDHPDLVVKTLKRWQKKVPIFYKKEFKFILERSLRSLIKQGHPESLSLLGVTVGQKHLKMKKLQLNKKKIKIGEAIKFSFVLENYSAQVIKYIVDYAVWHKKANGKITSKVFKLKSSSIAAKEIITIEKNHSFKPVTTRVYYPGEHKIEILINGRSIQQVNFILTS